MTFLIDVVFLLLITVAVIATTIFLFATIVAFVANLLDSKVGRIVIIVLLILLIIKWVA